MKRVIAMMVILGTIGHAVCGMGEGVVRGHVMAVAAIVESVE